MYSTGTGTGSPPPSYVPVTPRIVTSFLIFSDDILESIDEVTALTVTLDNPSTELVTVISLVLGSTVLLSRT